MTTDRGEVVEITFPVASTLRNEFTSPLPKARFVAVVVPRVDVAATDIVPVNAAPFNAAKVPEAYEFETYPIAVAKVFDA